jgi:hypothetical protein
MEKSLSLNSLLRSRMPPPSKQIVLQRTKAHWLGMSWVYVQPLALFYLAATGIEILGFFCRLLSVALTPATGLPHIFLCPFAKIHRRELLGLPLPYRLCLGHIRPGVPVVVRISALQIFTLGWARRISAMFCNCSWPESGSSRKTSRLFSAPR